LGLHIGKVLLKFVISIEHVFRFYVFPIVQWLLRGSKDFLSFRQMLFMSINKTLCATLYWLETYFIWWRFSAKFWINSSIWGMHKGSFRDCSFYKVVPFRTHDFDQNRDFVENFWALGTIYRAEYFYHNKDPVRFLCDYNFSSLTWCIHKICICTKYWNITFFSYIWQYWLIR